MIMLVEVMKNSINCWILFELVISTLTFTKSWDLSTYRSWLSWSNRYPILSLKLLSISLSIDVHRSVKQRFSLFILSDFSSCSFSFNKSGAGVNWYLIVSSPFIYILLNFRNILIRFLSFLFKYIVDDVLNVPELHILIFRVHDLYLVLVDLIKKLMEVSHL